MATKKPALYIVVFGDCFNGLNFVGPFVDDTEAEEYGEAKRGEDEEYHILDLAHPAAIA